MKFLARQICAFFMTIQFLTWLPVPHSVYRSDCNRLMAAYFPLAGAIVGALSALVLYVGYLAFPWMVAVALMIVVQGFITGAFHEDGLADVADGMGGYEPDKVLEIMRDSRVGTYALYAFVSMILLRYAAIVSIEPAQALRNVIAFAAASRFAGVMLLTIAPTPSEANRLGCTVSFHRAWGLLLFAAVSTLVIAWAVTCSALLILPFIIVGVPMLLRSYFISRIGGVTGDCAGATCVITETILHTIAVSKYV